MSDAHLFMTSVVYLRLKLTYNDEICIWKNSRPLSVHYCSSSSEKRFLNKLEKKHVELRMKYRNSAIELRVDNMKSPCHKPSQLKDLSKIGIKSSIEAALKLLRDEAKMGIEYEVREKLGIK